MDKSLRHSYSIRLIRPGDNAQVKSLVVDVMSSYNCIGDGFSSSDPELDNMYDAYSGERLEFYVVVDSQDKVYGCCGIAPLIGAEDHICELRKMYYYPSIRGLGLGSQMLELLLSRAKDLGFTSCYIETVSTMVEARVLYDKFGFQPISSSLGSTGHCGCDNYMIKALNVG
jgi:putative acetyltransferase